MHLSVAKYLLEQNEGRKLEAYLCTSGKWTIGIGHTKGVNPGDTITDEECDRLFAEDIEWADRAVVRWVKPKLNDKQRGALISFVFRIGETQWMKSTLLKALNNPKHYSGAIKVHNIPNEGVKQFLTEDGYTEIDHIQYNFVRWCWDSKAGRHRRSLYDRHLREYNVFSGQTKIPGL